MAILQKRARRKQTGGRYQSALSKRLANIGSNPAFTKMDPLRKIEQRKMGGGIKFRLLSSDTANVMDPKTKTHKVVKIITVVDNPANRNFIRRNIITRGAIINTDIGKARVTSRPGQDGIINAVLV
jgi:small subunit ribosomal protein S8e